MSNAKILPYMQLLVNYSYVNYDESVKKYINITTFFKTASNTDNSTKNNHITNTTKNNKRRNEQTQT